MDLTGNFVRVITDIVDVTAENDATYTYNNWDELSDSDGYFEGVNPVMNITFTTTHSSVGFILEGSNIKNFRVSWYGAGDEIIADGYFSDITRIPTKVINYKRIRIEVRRISSSEARINREVEVMYFGTLDYLWTSDSIVQANIVETSDITSNQLPSSQFTFSIIDPNDEFNLGNPNGLHHFIQPGQIVMPEELFTTTTIDSWHFDKKLQMGIYFIESFSVENNLVKFNCVDAITMLDKFQYNRGLMYDDGYYNFSSVKDIVDDIFSLLPYKGARHKFIYRIDSSLANIHLHGTIKPMTGRQALREVLFACGGICIPLRDGTNLDGGIHITTIDRTIKGEITISQKVSTKVSKLEYVSGITIEYTTYTPDVEEKDIETNTYPAGETTIIFSTPYKGITITSGTIIEAYPFYVKFSLDTSGEVTIKGIPYTSETKSVTATRQALSGQDGINEKKYTSQLCDNNLALEKANQILEYTALRLQVDTQYISDEDINIGDFLIIDNPNEHLDNYLAGVENLNIDLSGGFVTTAKLVGFFNYAFSFYRAGRELYTGDDIIV